MAWIHDPGPSSGMELTKALSLIEHPPHEKPAVWADLGCGEGIFTNALAHLLPPASQILAIDKDPSALGQIPDIINQVSISRYVLDFESAPWPGPQPDGVLMANSLHYILDKVEFLGRLKDWINPGGTVLIVEYKGHRANRWVPYPIGPDGLKGVLLKCGFHSFRVIKEIPSRYGSTLYGAIALPGDPMNP